ncbi:MAG: hypothetical protein ACRD1K_20660 [Acidimicrobiales bacterium]
MSKYDTLTVKQLEAAMTKLENQHVELKQAKRAASAALQAKQTAAEVRRKLAAMSDAERAALAQAIGAVGIEGGSAVGTPGAG